MMKPFTYLEPKDFSEACSWLMTYRHRAKLIAGGTDLLIAMKERQIAPDYVIDMKALAGLDRIHSASGIVRIGALATLGDVECSPIIKEQVPMLAGTAHKMANPGIRNMATIGGNLCNAAPSADMAPPLIGMGAQVKLAGPEGARTIPVEDFFVGPGENVLRDGEILQEIVVPDAQSYSGAVYLKMPARTAVGIALAGVAVVVVMDRSYREVTDAKIVLGAVAPTPMRAFHAEDVLKGRAVDHGLFQQAADLAASESNPISDVRASAEYRREVVKVLTRRALKEATRIGVVEQEVRSLRPDC
jgi:carbon-monoxide dehydrogenase medium subunit